jgi:hypothetical protein
MDKTMKNIIEAFSKKEEANKLSDKLNKISKEESKNSKYGQLQEYWVESILLNDEQI